MELFNKVANVISGILLSALVIFAAAVIVALGICFSAILFGTDLTHAPKLFGVGVLGVVITIFAGGIFSLTARVIEANFQR